MTDQRYQPGDKVKIKASLLDDIGGKSATIVSASVRYSRGQSYLVEFNGGDRRYINEDHFEAAA